MINRTITFEDDFQGQIMAIVGDKFGNWSNQSLVTTFKKDEFEKILHSYLNVEEILSKTDKYLSLKTKEFFSLYNNITLISDKCVIGYNVMSRNIKTNIESQVEEAEEDEEGIEIDMNVDNIDTNAEDIELVTDVFIYYSYESEPFINKMVKEIETTVYYDEAEKSGMFYTIGMSPNGYKLNRQEITEVSDNIELHYGEKFLLEHNDILENLRTKYHGLMLFYGAPGAGKTSYIRYLISQICKDKKIIYVPSYMIEQIAYPEFITFLQSHKESVLILEDAEFALQSRSNEFGAQAVSNLLNLTNGLLNDATKIQVIATFNMDKKNIDEALTRPGRLLNEWKFDKLTIEEGKKLAEFLGNGFDVTVESTVAEIYAGKVQVKKKTNKKVGF